MTFDRVEQNLHHSQAHNQLPEPLPQLLHLGVLQQHQGIVEVLTNACEDLLNVPDTQGLLPLRIQTFSLVWRRVSE